ncbi:hypothetical protein GOODEAATRI_030561, partial [Goodea atripinnis]
MVLGLQLSVNMSWLETWLLVKVTGINHICFTFIVGNDIYYFVFFLIALFKLQDANKRFGTFMGALSGGRIFITRMALAKLKMALTVAIRFSAIRQQFGPKDTEEIPILEYQLQQWRLIPYLAAAYALEQFSKTIFLEFTEFQIGQMTGATSNRQ